MHTVRSAYMECSCITPLEYTLLCVTSSMSLLGALSHYLDRHAGTAFKDGPQTRLWMTQNSPLCKIQTRVTVTIRSAWQCWRRSRNDDPKQSFISSTFNFYCSTSVHPFSSWLPLNNYHPRAVWYYEATITSSWDRKEKIIICKHSQKPWNAWFISLGQWYTDFHVFYSPRKLEDQSPFQIRISVALYHSILGNKPWTNFQTC